VALVIGSQAQITANMFKAGDTLASVIANEFAGEGGGLTQNALIGLGVILFILTIIVNLGARYVVGRAERHMQGAL